MLRNPGISANIKSVRRMIHNNDPSLLYAKHRNRTERTDLTKLEGINQLWETGIISALQGRNVLSDINQRLLLKEMDIPYTVRNMNSYGLHRCRGNCIC
ncbi:MAG: hypothetical protein QXV17_02915 [Candidatus Micrarchaeaceae archaeon]